MCVLLFLQENAANEKIEMTVPVLASIVPGQGPFCEENFTYHFYMPKKFQSNPPKPTDDRVFLTKLAPLTVAVASYGGFSDEQKVITNGNELFSSLNQNKVAVKTDQFYWAGYDSPFRLTDRHNEVMVAIESK